jgi:hypothetical protein
MMGYGMTRSFIPVARVTDSMVVEIVDTEVKITSSSVLDEMN